MLRVTFTKPYCYYYYYYYYDYSLVISSHGIAMPKGLYYTAAFFFLSFFDA